MIGLLLDTNVLSEFARTGKPDENVARFLEGTGENQLFVSVLTFAEIRRGVELLPPGKRRAQLEEWQEDLAISFEGRILPVTKSIADCWAVLSAKSQRRGITVANLDGLIAATALDHQLILVTRNIKDFSELGLVLLNPWTP